jgi:hypothetical protein
MVISVFYELNLIFFYMDDNLLILLCEIDFLFYGVLCTVLYYFLFSVSCSINTLALINDLIFYYNLLIYDLLISFSS